ncbi:phage major capsid protein [uncultured Rhodoblastus sp.]|uniref:phage major capsid protein n=1 Tax=uncultured Rhodoblastus sp. TaxID=543037 RepID=UPI0025E78083|nr:phage major capsid protein [uncultured Rhodoblastus sp.]
MNYQHLQPSHGLETKSYTSSDIKNLVEDVGRGFEAFKEKHSRELAELKRGRSDPISSEETNRINSAIDVMQRRVDSEILDIKRSAIFSAAREDLSRQSREANDYSRKFDSYLRKGGDNNKMELERIAETVPELKALSSNSEADGGFTVLPAVERQLISLALLISPIRAYAGVQAISTGSYKQPVNKRGTTAGWVGETDPRAQTAASQLAEIEIVPGEIYAQPAVTQQMLDDSFIDIEQWVASEASTIFAQKEGAAFISGDGSKKPKGFLTSSIVADASWAWGSIGYFATGASGDFTAVSATPGAGPDVFFDVIYGLKPQYRANARWAFNRRVQARLRKFKNSYGEYLWQPSLVAGAPATFAGYEIIDAEDMPDLAANSYSVIFADWKSFYRIVDRIGIRVLRDPFSSKPYVLFYTTKRVGGAVVNYEAAKILKAGTS